MYFKVAYGSPVGQQAPAGDGESFRGLTLDGSSFFAPEKKKAR